MKTSLGLFSVCAAVGLIGPAAQAQTPAAVAVPTTPAPAVAVPVAATASLGATARPAADRVISVPRLPTAAELTDIARAQGVTIEQIDQTASDVIIVYRFSDGRTSTVAYQLLAAAATPAGAVTGRTAPTVVYYEPVPEVRRVYYTTSAPVVYFDPFYYPWYGPVRVNLGFHWSSRGGYGGGHHHGGRHW